MSRGFLIYAHNNAEVDYGTIALVCATLIKRHLRENQTCLVTDEGTLGWMEQQRGKETVRRAFDEIKIVPYEAATGGSGPRAFRDGAYTTKTLLWHNRGRCGAYEASPFDETILLDSDYLVMDGALDAAWGLVDPVSMPTAMVPLDGQPPHADDRRMGPSGLPLRWATMVYFRRSPEAKQFFEQVRIVQEMWPYYAMTHGFRPGLYRNDFAFTIAAHLLDGGAGVSSLVPPLPGPGLVTVMDTDELIEVPGPGRMKFLLNDRTERWCYRVCRTDGLSVHVQNKFSIVRCADALLAHHGGAV